MTDDRPWLEYCVTEIRPPDRWLRQRSMAELKKYLHDFAPEREAALQQQLDAWQQFYDLVSYTVSVPDDSIRALYFYASALRFLEALGDNPFVFHVLALDDEGMRKSQEAARSGDPKSLGAWAMRLMLRSRDREAVAALQQAASVAPRYPLPRLLLGLLARSQGHAEKGDQQIRQGLQFFASDDLRRMATSLLQEIGYRLPSS